MNAFVLLYVIAYRAQRTAAFNRYNLQPGEAVIGDCENCGMSERAYRTAKQVLQKFKFATFRATSKGTIARLINTGIFDVNLEVSDGQNDEWVTDRRRTPDEQATTTKKPKKKKNEKKGRKGLAGASSSSEDFEVPREEQLWEFMAEKDLNPDFVEAFLRERARNGWKAKGEPIRYWRKALLSFCEKLESDQRHNLR